jgi:hypothetical protein
MQKKDIRKLFSSKLIFVTIFFFISIIICTLFYKNIKTFIKPHTLGVIPEICDKNKKFNTQFYSGITDCINIKSILNKYNIDLSPNDVQLKVTGIQRFDRNWFITLNNGFLVLLDSEDLHFKSIINLKSKHMVFATFGGVLSSFFTSKNIGYFYYTAENREKNKDLILEKIVFDENSSIISRFPLVVTNDSYEFSDLGGGIYSDGVSLLLGVGKGVSQFTGDMADRVQNAETPFGKYIKIDLSQFNRINRPMQKLKYTIFTTGHKNPQGLKLIYGGLFSIEHGPAGGDELNLLNQGKNYGWNKFSYGFNDIENKLFDGHRFNYENPLFYFTPSIGASDLAECPFISGKSSVYYSPCMIISSLREQSLFFLKFDNSHHRTRIQPSSLHPISVEKIYVGERIRKIFTEENRVTILSDAMNIYSTKFIPKFTEPF